MILVLAVFGGVYFEIILQRTRLTVAVSCQLWSTAFFFVMAHFVAPPVLLHVFFLIIICLFVFINLKIVSALF